MSEMVERVARAICHGRMINPDALAGNGEPVRIYHGNSVGYLMGEALPAWRFFVEDALSALGAMREPTEAMTAKVGGGPFNRDEVLRDWQAMIDEALK